MTVENYQALLAAAHCQRDVLNCMNGSLPQVVCTDYARLELMRLTVARLDDFANAEGTRGACFVADKLEGVQA